MKKITVTLATGEEFETVKDAAEFLGLKPSKIYKRIRSGWSIERALELIEIDPLVGRKFGLLKILKRSHLVPKRGYYYQCECDCGALIVRSGAIMKQAEKKSVISSCGCKTSEILKLNAKKRTGTPRNDISGATYGFLKVIKLAKNNNDRKLGLGLKWVCECVCGNLCEVPINWLTTKNTTSCGCRGKKNYLGLTVGKLSILSKNSNGTWVCQCRCGRQRNYTSKRIEENPDCGCNVPEKAKGMTIHELTVIERLHQSDQPYNWLCACSCRNTISVLDHDLFNGRIISCGCKNNSQFKSTKAYRVALKEMVGTYHDTMGSKAFNLDHLFLLLDKISTIPGRPIASPCFGIIYKATHSDTGRLYIGLTYSKKNKSSQWLLEARKKRHLLTSKKPKTHFANALNKYGSEAFKWEEMFCCTDTTALNFAEFLMVEAFKANDEKFGFNSLAGGLATKIANKPTKKKMSTAAQSRWSSLSQAERQALTDVQHPPSIPFKGELVRASKIANELNCTEVTVRNWFERGYETGEEIIKAFEKNLNKSILLFENGTRCTISEFAKSYDLSNETVKYHLDRGKSPDYLQRRFSVKVEIENQVFSISKFSKICGLTVAQVEKKLERGASYQTIYDDWNDVKSGSNMPDV